MKRRLSVFFLCGIICMLTCFSFACTAPTTQHHIGVQSSDLQNGGRTTGAGLYKTYETVKLTAIPNENHTFLAWTFGDQVVSYDKDYEFTASSQTEGNYLALFSTNNKEFCLLKSASYEFIGVELNSPSLALNRVINWSLKSNNTSGLYKNLAYFEDKTIENTGSFKNEQIAPLPKVFYLDDVYYFDLKMLIEYSIPNTNSLTTESPDSRFFVDFKKLFSASAVINDNLTTYDDTTNKYKLTLETMTSGYTIKAEFYGLTTPVSWTPSATPNQSLILNFEYPFEAEEE